MRLLGIEVAPHEVRVAHGERALGRVRLRSFARLPLAAPAQLPDVLRELARTSPHSVLTALPLDLVTHRMLVLPFRDRRRLGRAAPLELLGQLPAEVDDALVASSPLGAVAAGTAVLAAVVRRTDLAAHRAAFEAAGLPLGRTDLAPLPAWNLLRADDADLALLVADGTRSTLSLRRGGRIAHLRALGASAGEPEALAAEVRWTLAAMGGATVLVLAGADASPALGEALRRVLALRIVPLADAVGATLPASDAFDACAVAAGLVAGAGARTRIGLALDAERRGEPASFRRAAALAAAALLLAALDLGLVRHGLARRDAALARAIATEAAAALPGERMVAPREQLEAAVAAAARRELRLGGGASTLEVLRALSARVPAAIQLDLDELAIEPDAVLLHGRAGSFDAVDALRRALPGTGLGEATAEETRTTVDGRGVEFRLRAPRLAPGASS